MDDKLGPISLKVNDPYELQIFGEKIIDEVGNQIQILIDNAYVEAHANKAIAKTIFLSMYYSSILIFKKKQIAWLSALLYTFSLYRLTDIYVRGALGEILALVFFPLIISG